LKSKFFAESVAILLLLLLTVADPVAVVAHRG
jgi:hypothetical protein